jgi:mono/diheme cytochrome c family protein
MTTLVLSLACLIVGSVAVPTVRAGQADPTDFGGGNNLFVSYCASCHGPNGRGDGPVAPYLSPKPANLTLLAKLNGGTFPSENVAKAIDGRGRVKSHGNTQMPVWGTVLSKTSEGSDAASVAAKIQALVKHVESIQAR